MDTTRVYDSYWRFAAERLSVYMRRLSDPTGPWTDDPVIRSYRFTNTYRVADRVSQYLIREVQYGEGRSQAPAEVFFRTILFKIFNKIETWKLLERSLGELSWQAVDLGTLSDVLDGAMRRGIAIYSAAYIMPAPRFGKVHKHANHLALLQSMMENGLPTRIERASSLAEVYEQLRTWPGLGSFLAFQYAIDLNYSSLLDFNEEDFVVAGPGALDGIAKCFSSTGGRKAEDVIFAMVDAQDREFARLGIEFPGLFGRRLQPIDCQNIFCEISKYARVAYPDVAGISGRTRIKQGYSGGGSVARPFFPPRWCLPASLIEYRVQAPRQGVLL
jgi:hypothetical protein